MIGARTRPIIVPYRGPDGADPGGRPPARTRSATTSAPAGSPAPCSATRCGSTRTRLGALRAAGAARTIDEDAFADQFVVLADETLYDPAQGLRGNNPESAPARATAL